MTLTVFVKSDSGIILFVWLACCCLGEFDPLLMAHGRLAAGLE